MKFIVLGLAFACTSALAQDKTVIAVVGGTTFGYPPDFAKGLAEEEGSFTIETSVGESQGLGISVGYIPSRGWAAPGTGAREGLECDRWSCVDCHPFLQSAGR